MVWKRHVQANARRWEMMTIMMEQDQMFMQEAIAEAEEARAKGEVPIGAVIVHEGSIVGRGHNLRETSNDPTSAAAYYNLSQTHSAGYSFGEAEAALRRAREIDPG